MASGGQTSSSDTTSRSLLRRVKDQDPSAWSRLSHVYSPLVYCWCRRAGLQASDAADVVQDVFRAVFCSIGGFTKERAADSFRGWLWTITRNKIRDHNRDRARQPQAGGGTAAYSVAQQLSVDPPEEADEPSVSHLRSQLARRAMDLMQTDFAENTWQAFWLTAVELQPAAEVGRRLEMSLAAVYMAKSRVLRRLRDELDGLDLLE